MPDTENVPLNDFVRHVNDVLGRADALFGSAGIDAPAGASAQQLTQAADATRRIAAPDMAGAAVAGYSTFAQEKASALTRLAESDAALDGVLQDAAQAENAAASASSSALSSAAAHSERLGQAAAGPTGHRALIAALTSEVQRQQDLVQRHQQHATALTEQVRLVTYD